jgi:hypothetical protein
MREPLAPNESSEIARLRWDTIAVLAGLYLMCAIMLVKLITT